MFTGIIEGLGTIAVIRPAGGGKQMTVEADFTLTGTKTGDSIAVNGACLTVVSLENRRFRVDVSPETLSNSTFDKALVGQRVNLERALCLGQRLDGHLVSGHVDGTGVIESKKAQGNAVQVGIRIAPWLGNYMIPKGSVAVDGISLTINRCEVDRFWVSIIPHTAQMTTIGFKREREAVNIEADMLGKYVERFVAGLAGNAQLPRGKSGGIDEAFLAKQGFIKNDGS